MFPDIRLSKLKSFSRPNKRTADPVIQPSLARPETLADLSSILGNISS